MTIRKFLPYFSGRAPLYSGLFVPALPPETIQEAIDVSMANRAAGVCYFEFSSLSEEHWKVVEKNK